MDKLQATHDELVAAIPEGSTHSTDSCMFCNGEYAALIEGETVSDKTYTEGELEAQVAAAVATATSELTSKIAGLTVEVEEAKKKGKNPFADDAEDKKDGGKDEDKEKTSLYTQVADLTVKLDAAVAESVAAKAAHDALVAMLETADADEKAQVEKAALRTDRIAKVAEVITFTPEHIEERADSWTSLDDAQFEAMLADYKALGIKPTTSEKSEPLPRFTAMQASRETDESTPSAAIDLIRGRNLGLDVRATR